MGTSRGERITGVVRVGGARRGERRAGVRTPRRAQRATRGEGTSFAWLAQGSWGARPLVESGTRRDPRRPTTWFGRPADSRPREVPVKDLSRAGAISARRRALRGAGEPAAGG